MKDKGSVVQLVGIAFVAGFVLAALLFLRFGGKLTKIEVGGFEIEMPTDRPPATSAFHEVTPQPTGATPTATSVPPSATVQQAPVSGHSCIATEQGPLPQGNHVFTGPVHVVQLWRQNGESPWGTGEVMAVVVGDVTVLGAGGNVWTYPSSECRDVAEIQMLDGAKMRGSTVVTEEELREARLIQ